jgi:hypothetical protein
MQMHAAASTSLKEDYAWAASCARASIG